MVTAGAQECRGWETWGIRAALRPPILDLSRVNGWGLQISPVVDSIGRRRRHKQVRDCTML